MNESEEIRKALYDKALFDYNEAYYRWLFGPEKDKYHNSLILEKFRRIWFNS